MRGALRSAPTKHEYPIQHSGIMRQPASRAQSPVVRMDLCIHPSSIYIHPYNYHPCRPPLLHARSVAPDTKACSELGERVLAVAHPTLLVSV